MANFWNLCPNRNKGKLTNKNKLSVRELYQVGFLFFLVGLFSACSDDHTSSEKIAKNSRPESNRFTQVVVVEGLDQPLQLEFDRHGNVYWIERTGKIKRINESTKELIQVGEISVAKEPAPGLVGFLLDKNFQKTRQLYLYYSAAEDEGKIMRLSRFTLGENDKILMNSEVILLDLPWEYPDGNHFGGGMAWDEEGNLYLAVGGDTTPTQYSPLEFTNKDGEGEDEARTAGNTNDLRGSILRIHPRPDGSYTIPEGNLFAQGTPRTRPEIYVMGNRNPWRLSIDSKTGYLHWGEVGPDAGVDSEKYGPMGFDEFNVAKEAGNFGWPFLIGKNKPYNRYDYKSKSYQEPFDAQSPINESPNNTGLRQLPPAQPALVAYPYQVSGQWPVLGSAGRSAVGGPVFRTADFQKDLPGVFPNFFEGKWLVTDYVRNWIMVVTMDENRHKVISIEPFLPAEQLSHKQPLDMDFGPDGSLYLLEYALGNQGRLSKIVYNAGNRAPVADATAKPQTGTLPLKVVLSARNSKDYDKDSLIYNWTIKPVAGGEVENFNVEDTVITFEQPGKYQVQLTVKELKGKADSDTIEIVAGNEIPQVKIQITKGNRSFFFPDEIIRYKVQVSDAEDGSLSQGGISPAAVSVTAEYIPSGITMEQLAELEKQSELNPDTNLRHLKAQALLTQNNCFTCHKVDEPLVGPPFRRIADKYKGDVAVFEKLSESIVEGSAGKWGGTIPMPPHPMISQAEIQEIIKYIQDMAASSHKEKRSLPVTGNFQTVAYESKVGGGRLEQFFSPPYQTGSYVIHSQYKDRGNSQIPGLELSNDDVLLLRYPLLSPETADVISKDGISFTPSTNDPGFIFTGKGGYIGFRNIDLTGINRINVGAITRFWHWSHFIGATIELRLGSPTGKVVGEPYERVSPLTSNEEGPFMADDWDKPIPIDVSEVNGIQDIFIVVHNSRAEQNDALIIMTGIQFKQ